MSHRIARFGAIHAAVGPFSIEDGTDENATDGTLVVEARLFRTTSREVPELAVQRLCGERAG
jgi:hypothetical protein